MMMFSISYRICKRAVASIFTVLILVSTGTSQRIVYVKEPIQRPAGLKEGDQLQAGQLITTGVNGRIILNYMWPSSDPAFPCRSWWILNGELTQKVPERPKGPGCASTGSKDTFAEGAKGVGWVTFWSYPGKLGNRVSGTGFEQKGLEYTMRMIADVSSALASLPRSTYGNVQDVRDGEIFVEDVANDPQSAPQPNTTSTVIAYKVTQATSIVGVKALNDLKGVDVYLEYSPGKPNEARLIMPVKHDAFYQLLGFSKQASASDSCNDLPISHSCIKFDDGYVWLIQDTLRSQGKPHSKYGLTRVTVIGDKAEYHHILDTSFVMTIPNAPSQ